jgi:trimeric autotransporter adhesin
MIFTTKKALFGATLALFLGSISSMNAQSYCTVSSTPWNYWMTKVSIGSTSFTSSKEPYGNFVSSTFTVDRGQVNTLILESFENGTWIANSSVYWAAWIDFNGNGVFTDAGEMVINPASATKTYNFANGGGNLNNLSDRQVSATISVPTSTINGTKRMRVMFKGGSAPASNGCETVAAGEVEDYTVNITGTTTGGGCTSAPTVACPSNITLTAVSGATTATTNFTTATASSPCGVTPTVAYTVNGTVVNFTYAFPIGTTTVTATASHTSNAQTASCSFTVTVNAGTTSSGGGGQWTGTNQTDNISRMGRVAIGTTNFGADNTFNLLVRGGIRTEKIKMDVASANQWADYVFAKGYDLKPLKEVKQYIDKNKHLPNVPSAEELTKQGLDVMQMMAKQQEKIEELYLYMIQLNETIAKQQTEIKALKGN